MSKALDPKAIADCFRSTRNARFYRRTGSLSKARMARIFRLASHAKDGRSESAIRVKMKIDGEDVIYSQLVFRYKKEPTFLPSSGLVEIRYAFLLIVEAHGFLSVLRRGVSAFDDELDAVVESVPHNTIAKVFAQEDTAFEKLSLGTMSVSDFSLRRRSLEAKNLANNVPATSASRSIVRSTRLRNADIIRTITPGSGQISEAGKAQDLEGLLGWCRSVCQELRDFADHQGFLDNFAEPVAFGALPSTVKPVGLLLDLRDLWAAIDEGEVTLQFTQNSGLAVDVPDVLVRRIAARSEEMMLVDGDGTDNCIRCRGLALGNLRRNAKSLTVRSDLLRRLSLVAADGTCATLDTFINKAQRFTVVFSDPAYAYYGKRLFRDTRLVGHIESFLTAFLPLASLNTVTSEKGGQFKANQKIFGKDSLFRVVEDELAISAKYPFLVCDDLGTEWADHLGVSPDGDMPTIALFHSKHGELGLSASKFQDVLGQAQKNLHFLSPDPHELSHRVENKWSETYRNDKVTTSISRVRRGARNQLEAAFTKVISAPNASKKVFVVVSFLSKGDFGAQLTRIANGQPVRPNVVQLLWLLADFFGGVREVGAQPFIVCRP